MVERNFEEDYGCKEIKKIDNVGITSEDTFYSARPGATCYEPAKRFQLYNAVRRVLRQSLITIKIGHLRWRVAY